MEELRRLAAQYYHNTVGARFFGIKGWLLIVLSIPFLAWAIYEAFKQNYILMMLFEGVSVACWSVSKKEYNKNLVRHLSYHSMVESEIAAEHKAAYLSVITSHVSPCLFETARIFKEVIETNNKYNEFVFDNITYLFSRFIYDPESKDRIINLLIYLVSLVALLIVTKPDSQYEYIYLLISYIHVDKILFLLVTGVVFIVIGYISIVIPLIFLRTFLVNPILLHISFGDITVRFFISELNRYSYLEKRIEKIENNSVVRL